MDVFDAEQRSAVMRAVKSKGTKPEIKVRRLLHKAGYRYRLHRKDLPGNPDLVFPSRRAVIFVHGCFWHRHKGCGRMPKSKLSYWLPKLEANKTRDQKNQRALRRSGWRVLVIWECQLRDKNL